MISWVNPLQFPQDAERFVPRRLRHHNKSGTDSITHIQFRNEVSESRKWFALLSAEGAGKTSLLNWLAEDFKKDETTLVLPPINLSSGYKEVRLHGFSLTLFNQIRDALLQYVTEFPVGKYDEDLGKESLLNFPRAVQSLVGALPPPITRLVIQLDNLEAISVHVAEAISDRLRELHEINTETTDGNTITVVLSGTDDLRTITKHNSPLRNIVEPYELLDWSPTEFDKFLDASKKPFDMGSGREAVEYIYEQTNGYPFFCQAIASQLDGISRIRLEDVKRAITQSKFSKLGTLLDTQKIQTINDTIAHAGLLAALNAQKLPTLGDTTANSKPTKDLSVDEFSEPIYFDKLRLHGVIAGSANQPRWRNPIVKRYYSDGNVEPSIMPELRGTGTIFVSLILNFRHFVRNESGNKDLFDQLRGSEAYEAALKRLLEQIENGNESFRVSPNEARLRKIASDLNIFRHESATVAFAPTYEYIAKGEDGKSLREYTQSTSLADRFDGSDSELQEFVQLVSDEWNRWDTKSIQLTRDGLAHVRLSQSFREQPLAFLAARVVGLQEGPETSPRNDRTALDLSSQLEIAMTLVEMLIDTTFRFDPDENLHNLDSFTKPIENEESEQDSEVNDSSKINIRFVKAGDRSVSIINSGAHYPIHDRYVTYAFQKLCACGAGSDHLPIFRNLTSTDFYADEYLAKEYGRQLHSLLDGMLLDDQNGSKLFPKITSREVKNTIDNDLSSWEDELFLVSQDNSVIYYSQLEPVSIKDEELNTCDICGKCLKIRVQKMHISNMSDISYEEYWLCILRGIEYILSMRLLARIFGSATTHELENIAKFEVSSLGDRLKDESVAEKVREEVDRMWSRLATSTRILAHLHDATIPMFMARADYATHKFDKFIEVSGLEKTIKNVEQDISAITTFLQHVDSISAETQTQRLMGKIDENRKEREKEQKKQLEQLEQQRQKHDTYLADERKKWEARLVELEQDHQTNLVNERKQHEIQLESTRQSQERIQASQNRTLAIIGFTISFVSLCAVIPSYLVDFEDSQFGIWLSCRRPKPTLLGEIDCSNYSWRWDWGALEWMQLVGLAGIFIVFGIAIYYLRKSVKTQENDAERPQAPRVEE